MVAEQRGQVLSFGHFPSDLLFHNCQALGRIHHHLQTLLRNDNHSVFIPDDPVSGMYNRTAALDWHIDFTGVLSPSGVGNHCPGKHGKLIAMDFVQVANGSINHHPLQSLQPGCQGRDLTPKGRVELSLAIDHQNTPFRAL